jgi:hypothetical protein
MEVHLFMSEKRYAGRSRGPSMGTTVVDGSTIDGCLTQDDPRKETHLISMAPNSEKLCVTFSVWAVMSV